MNPPKYKRARLKQSEMIALGMDPTKCAKRTQTRWVVQLPTKKKYEAMRAFLRLPQTIVLDMAIEALVAFINQRHLANGGDAKELISWNSDIIDNPAFYSDASKYWGGWSDTNKKRIAYIERHKQDATNPGKAANSKRGRAVPRAEVSGVSTATHEGTGGARVPPDPATEQAEHQDNSSGLHRPERS